MDDRCQQCAHFYEDQSEYHDCHVCEMDHNCFQQKEEEKNTMPHVMIITDGACSGNPGPGGWAAILQYKNVEMVIGGNAVDTTNNRMELQAVLSGLQSLKCPCEVSVITDSAYIANTGNGGWIRKWEENDWKKASNKPVKNVDLWTEIAKLMKTHQVKFQKVQGHAGNYLNERADAAAVQMRDQAKAGKIVHRIKLNEPHVMSI